MNHDFSRYFPTCVYCLHVSTCAYMCLHVSTCAYMCLHVSTCVYMCLHVPTCVYMCLHVSTCVYMCLHVSTCAYMCLHVPTCAYMCLHVPTCAYLCHLCTTSLDVFTMHDPLCGIILKIHTCIIMDDFSSYHTSSAPAAKTGCHDKLFTFHLS